jgi:hypothetical protein
MTATGVGLAALISSAVAGAQTANPFALSQSGLPHQVLLEQDQAMWRIQENIAHELIMRVFLEEGIVLNPTHVYDNGDTRFLASGYNPQLKIGYVLAGPGNLEPDAFVDWLLASVQRPDASPELVRKYLLTMRESLPENFQAEVDAALRFTDLRAQQEAIQYIRGEMWRLSDAGRTRLSLAEARELERKAAAGEEFIAVISQYDDRFSAPNYFVLAEAKVRKEMANVRKIKDPVKRRKKSTKIVERARKEATRAHTKASQKALAQLEATTRDYIRWARTKGLGASPSTAP